MIPRYRLLAERIRAELLSIDKVVERAESAAARAVTSPEDSEYFAASAALDLHSFYSGLERVFELIAGEIDERHPSGSSWHRELLTQMSLAVSEVRPAVLSAQTASALSDYLEFRHVVRNMYTFNLRPDRVIELTGSLRPTYDSVRHDLQLFVGFLVELSDADEDTE